MSTAPLQRFVLAALLCASALAAASSPALAGDRLVPVPSVVIYPGDIIRSGMLQDIAAPADLGDGAIVESRLQAIGKASRRTLLPGQFIPIQALDNPRIIRNGALVEMVYVDGALTIQASGAAMQDGALGDIIRLRNVDTGVYVEGRVQADGTVRVGG